MNHGDAVSYVDNLIKNPDDVKYCRYLWESIYVSKQNAFKPCCYASIETECR